MADRRPMGALERAVLEQLWRSPEGATPGEIQSAMDEPVGYTTVTTVLARLSAKGLVERERAPRGFRYRASNSEADLIAGRMQAALAPAKDRPSVLSQFVDGLSKKDERALRAILRDLDR